MGRFLTAGLYFCIGVPKRQAVYVLWSMLQCLSGHNEKVDLVDPSRPLASCGQSKLDNGKAWEQG